MLSKVDSVKLSRGFGLAGKEAGLNHLVIVFSSQQERVKFAQCAIDLFAGEIQFYREDSVPGGGAMSARPHMSQNKMTALDVLNTLINKWHLPTENLTIDTLNEEEIAHLQQGLPGLGTVNVLPRIVEEEGLTKYLVPNEVELCFDSKESMTDAMFAISQAMQGEVIFKKTDTPSKLLMCCTAKENAEIKHFADMFDHLKTHFSSVEPYIEHGIARSVIDGVKAGSKMFAEDQARRGVTRENVGRVSGDGVVGDAVLASGDSKTP